MSILKLNVIDLEKSEYKGGKSFYTGLGHLSETYADERFIKLLTGGILYVSNN